MNIVIKAQGLTAPMAGEILAKAKNNEAGEIPIFVLKNELGTQYNAYAEDVSADHMIGFVLSADGKSDIEALDDAFQSQPEIRITGAKGKLIDAVLKPSKTSSRKTKKGGESDELKALWESKIKEGIVDEDFRKNVTALLNDHEVCEFDRMRIVSQYRLYYDADGNLDKPVRPAHPYVNVDKTRKNGSMYDHSTMAELLNAFLNHQPIVCEGDKSTGKSVAVKTAAYILGMPIKENTYSEDMLKSDPIAFQSFDDGPMKQMKKRGAEAYMLYMADPVKYADRFEEAMEYMYWKDRAMTPQLKTELGEMGKWALEGGIYVANEANLARVNIRESLFNPAAEDNDPHLTIPGMGTVSLNKDCILVVTQNRDYAGTNGSNDAIDSRFGKVKFPNAEDITFVLKTMTESDCGADCLKMEYYKRANTLYRFFLGQVRDGLRENSILSIRSFGKALKDVALGGGNVTLHSKLIIYLQSMTHSEEEDRALVEDIQQYIGTL